MLSQNIKFIQVVDPVADFANADPDSKVVGCGQYRWATFIISVGAAAGAGDLQPIIYATDVNAKTNKTKVGYWLAQGTGSTPDTTTEPIRNEAGSETNIAAANMVATQHIVEVDIAEAKAVQQAAGFAFNGIFMNLNETQGDAITGGVVCLLSEGRVLGNALPTSIIA